MAHRNDLGRSLCKAVAKNDKALVVKLLAAGVDVNYCDMRDEEMTPLMHAAESASMDVLDILLKAGADVHQQSHYGMTPLHFAVNERRLNIIHRLIALGACVNSRAIPSIGTPLVMAVTLGDELCVCALSSAGAQIQDDGLLLLDRAIHQGHNNMLPLLLELGCPVDSAPGVDGPIHTAAGQTDPKALNILVKAGTKVNAEGENGVTPLLVATRNGCTPMVKALIAAGADVNIHDRTYSVLSACHYAAQLGHVQCLQALIEAGADMESKDRDGFTPLLRAVAAGEHPACEVLIQQGCDVNAQGVLPCFNVREIHPISAIECAVEVGDFPLARALLKAGINRGILQMISQKLRTIVVNKEDPDFIALSDDVDMHLHQPAKLSHICRLVIRKNLHHPCSKSVAVLSIPSKVKEYILLKDVVLPNKGTNERPKEDKHLAYYMPSRWINPNMNIYAS